MKFICNGRESVYNKETKQEEREGKGGENGEGRGKGKKKSLHKVVTEKKTF